MIDQKQFKAFEAVIHDLKRVLVEEQDLLARPDTGTYEVIAIRKLQIFGKLNQYRKNGLESQLFEPLENEVREIDGLLAQNSLSLKIRMEAISEVSHTISKAFEEAESDGTYQASRRQ